MTTTTTTSTTPTTVLSLTDGLLRLADSIQSLTSGNKTLTADITATLVRVSAQASSYTAAQIGLLAPSVLAAATAITTVNLSSPESQRLVDDVFATLDSLGSLPAQVLQDAERTSGGATVIRNAAGAFAASLAAALQSQMPTGIASTSAALNVRIASYYVKRI